MLVRSLKSVTIRTPSVGPPLALVIGLLVAWFAYNPATNGSLHFDDPHNLGGLAEIHDGRSAIEFVVQGTSGPLGRPIALATFVPQAYAWPDSPDVFLHTNILLHLLNGVLVVWLLYLLTLIHHTRERAAWIATASGVTWLLLPILASSSLLIVQRMTLLSATFSILGFIGYLYSRQLLNERPKISLALMMATLACGTVLAMFAKENGVLLPLFVLVSEVTLLKRPRTAQARALHRYWPPILLVPLVLVFVYLLLQLDYSESTVALRDFTASDRLLSEARILWEYLFNAFFPAMSNLGPFHDAHALSTDWTSLRDLVPVVGWIAAIATAVLLRRNAPIFPFAIGWYLTGHVLESTSIPLELYFEHRNYLPLIGPVFGLIAGLFSLEVCRGFVRSAVALYVLLLASVLFNTCTVWGHPALAGEMWAIHNPTSKRATQYLVQQLEQAGDYSTARRMLRKYLAVDPSSAGVELQIVGLSCLLQPNSPQTDSLNRIRSNLVQPRFEHGVFETLRRLYGLSTDRVCAAATPDLVYSLASLAAANPAYQSMPVEHHNLHVLMAEHAFSKRDLDLTMHHIELALQSNNAVSTLVLGVQMLASADLFAAAEQLISAHENSPKTFLRVTLRSRRIDELRRALDELRIERQAQNVSADVSPRMTYSE